MTYSLFRPHRNAGENAAEAAAEEEEEAKKQLEDWEDKKAAVMDKILVAKGEQATARVEETQGKMLMMDAKRKYYKIMNEIKRVNAKRKQSLQIADAAEAKKAAVETEGKIAELMSESAAALASSHAEQGEKTIEDVTSKMGMDQEQEADQDAKKQELMAAVLKSLGEKLDFDNEAKFINGRAALADGHAKNVLETAARHRSEVSLTERVREGGRGGRGILVCVCVYVCARALRGGMRETCERVDAYACVFEVGRYLLPREVQRRLSSVLCVRCLSWRCFCKCWSGGAGQCE